MVDPLESIDGVDSLLSFFQPVYSMSSRSNPLRLSSVFGLAITRLQRHMLSDQREDIEKAILYLTESILLQSSSTLEHGPMILQALFFLAYSLIIRSALCKQPEDAIYAAKYLRHLRDQPHGAFGFPHHTVTKLLVPVLAFQAISEASNAVQNIEEMTVLCHELLTSDVSDGGTAHSITLFAMAILSSGKILHGVPDQLLNQVIECLRLARMQPGLREVHVALTFCLSIRYGMTFVNDDYEEAVSILDEINAKCSPGDSQERSVAIAQQLMTVLAALRSRVHEIPENSEEAIYRARAFLDSSSLFEHPLMKSFANFILEDTAKQRFHYFGSIDGLKASSSNPPLSLMPVDNDSEFGRTQKRLGLIVGLLSGIDNDDLTKIDEAIEKGRTILASSDPRHQVTSFPFALFGSVLFEAFERTKKIEYLNESISTRRQVMEHPFVQFLGLTILSQLSQSLLTRSEHFPSYRPQDLDEGLELLSQCINDGRASLPDRLRFACQWATVARRTGHPSISRAYESAVSSMQDALLFAPTLQQQDATLATSYHSQTMPLDYASYQVDLHQLEEAIETLERGRALLWSEMRHLRTSVDQVLEVDPQLGYEFAVVNQDLEELTKSISPSPELSMDDGAAGDFRAVDPFGHLLLKQRSLLKERENLISQIQALPGFDSFLATPSFDRLRSAASSGPVIIINHSSWRSDILILLHNASPSLIPTPDDFFGRASALKNRLLDARNQHGPDSGHYNDTLAHVLTELYDLVGKPVIDRLRQLKVPEQSRVWWCPTSDFCSLPLHAMGPIPSDDGSEERYFLDIYIPSYTPTLSALILESDHHEPGALTSSLPSLLLVAHFDVPSPDVSLSEVCEDVDVVRALNTRLPVKSLISEGATTRSTLDGLRDHQFVHFVCHGTLEAKKPFDAGFELGGNERVTLLDIVRSRLPAAEFAFLSACHTAELTDGSSADEVLHLAAAVQYCGFRSVVGTMWAMANTDGADLAKNFYKAMFSRREQGEPVPVPYYKRSAGALRNAVKKLRKKRGITLERWVNFVHYGA